MTALLIFLLVSGTLLAFIMVINLLASYRRLKARNIPHPFLVLWQRTIGRMLTVGATPAATLLGHQALLKWDIRWVRAGETLASVTSTGPEDNELVLQLVEPIYLARTDTAPEVRLETVRFKPIDHRRCAYGRGTVSGTLLPTLDKGLSVTAELIVYPAKA